MVKSKDSKALIKTAMMVEQAETGIGLRISQR